MYVSRLYIKNYRSIKELDIPLHKGKNVIIGRNNCGKSNIVKALDIVLGETSPTYAKSENITLGDFHTWKEEADGETVTKSAPELFIWCELIRDDGEPLNYDELYKCFGFYVCLQAWKGPPLRIDASLLPQDYDEIFGIDEDSCPAKNYVNPKLRNQGTMEGEFEDKYRFAFAFKATNDDGRITKEIRLLYRESDTQNWVMAFKAHVRMELLQTAIIPSFRDPQQQLRLTTWTWYGKLMQRLTAKSAKEPQLKQAFEQVHIVANEIFADIQTEVTRSTLDVAFPGTELHFHLNPDTQLDLYKNCLIYVDDGFKSLLTDKGSGIQSATIIGLFSYYTQHVNTKTSALLCIEEPEVYLHPHARRVVSERLTDFIGERNQVILTTHSAEFLRSTGEDLHVISVRNDRTTGTTSVPVNLKEYAGILINDAAHELFFADKVIICEGFDDFIVRAVAREAFPKQLDAQNVTVLSVGGKDNISKIAKLVLKLGLSCYVVADFDYLLRDAGDERKQYDAKAHESITSLGQPFFEQPCILGEGGGAMFSELQRVRAAIKKNEEPAFYTASKSNEIEEDVAILLETLRASGACILSGQMEDAWTDATFSGAKKLDLRRLYDLNQRLADGQSIKDIFNTSELEELLAHVLNQATTEREAVDA